MSNVTSTHEKFIKPSRFDGNDVLYYAGLLLLGAGLAFLFSWKLALAATGAVLLLTGLINSYVLLWMNRK